MDDPLKKARSELSKSPKSGKPVVMKIRRHNFIKIRELAEKDNYGKNVGIYLNDLLEKLLFKDEEMMNLYKRH